MQNEEQKPVFLQDILAAMRPKPIAYYRDLVSTAGVQVKTKLSQDEACLVLRVYDYGIAGLDPDELQLLNQVFGKLKDQIWP